MNYYLTTVIEFDRYSEHELPVTEAPLDHRFFVCPLVVSLWSV
jgi:hypothetical protein